MSEDDDDTIDTEIEIPHQQGSNWAGSEGCPDRGGETEPLDSDVSPIPWKAPPALTRYLERIGAEVRNFRRFVIKREGRDHYHRDHCVIRVVDGKLVLDEDQVKEFGPDKEERIAIEAEFAAIDYPKSIMARDTYALRTFLRSRGYKDPTLYEFRHPSEDGVLFVQQRIYKDGHKADIPWSYWSDGEWRCMEPEGLLPLFGLEKLKTAATVFLHEGSKGASVVREPDWQQNHPWAKEISGPGVVHLGWPGGAPNSHRVDWSPIRALSPHIRVIIVADNDIGGRNAASAISKRLQRKLWALQFGTQFKAHFDLADPFPDKLFNKDKGYIGPSFDDCLVSATWATRKYKGEDGRDHYTLREEFEAEWYAVVSPLVFVHRERVDRQLVDKEFNAQCRPFSDVPNVAALLQTSAWAKAEGIVYEPGHPPGGINMKGQGGGIYVNVHRPSLIKPVPHQKGEEGPWLKFMEKLIPKEEDRNHLLKYCATLIARPGVRITHGVLLLSDTQGVGKGTLGEKILEPIIGEHNTSAPSESDIVDGTFNFWAHHKRLVIVHEIYAGQSAKAYNKLKSVITERMINISAKYQNSYKTRNWLHIFACSNSMRALKLGEKDRRWFIPEVSEEKQSDEYWVEFNAWLEDRGLGIIAHWAHDYVEEHGAIFTGQEPPMSERKAEVIAAGMSDGERMITELGMALAARKQPTVVRLDRLRMWLSNKKAAYDPAQYTDGRKLETAETISSKLRAVAGLKLPRKQYAYEGLKFRAVANFVVDEELKWPDLKSKAVEPKDVEEF